MRILIQNRSTDSQELKSCETALLRKHDLSFKNENRVNGIGLEPETTEPSIADWFAIFNEN